MIAHERRRSFAIRSTWKCLTTAAPGVVIAALVLAGSAPLPAQETLLPSWNEGEVKESILAFVSRATTPGTFVVPPAKAEEMYFPEVFGRSASDQVIVK